MIRSAVAQKEVSKQPKKLFNRHFFLLWQGQTISRLGSQGFYVAMLFWIKHETGSAALMGLLSMLSSLPGILLGPVAGAFADRHYRRDIIMLCDYLRGVAVIVLSALMFIDPEATDLLLVALFTVSVFISAVSAFFDPAITASIPDLVPKERVAGANSMAQLSYQLSVFIGQGLGGTLFRILGAPVLFFIDGATYLFAASSEAFISIPQSIPKKRPEIRGAFDDFRRDISEGLRFVWNQKGLRELVFVQMLLSFFMAPVVLLLPFYVEDVLNAQPDWYGFLLAGYGAGTLGGYLFAGAIQISGRKRAIWMTVGIILDSVGYAILGLTTHTYMALGLAVLGGFTGGFAVVTVTTILQITTPSEIRGRVFGLLGTIAGGLAPLAMGLAGVLTDLLGQNIPLIYIGCSVIMTGLTILIAFSPDYWRFITIEQKEVDVDLQEQPVMLD